MGFHDVIELVQKAGAVWFITWAMYDTIKGDRQGATNNLAWAILLSL